MDKLTQRISAAWCNLKGPATVTLLTIFAIRLFSVVINLRTHLGELWRPRLFEPKSGSLYMAMIFVPVILMLHRRFIQLSSHMQNRYLIFHFATWLTMVFFNNVSDRCTYLYHIFDGRMDGEILESLLVMDTFFQPPGIFWGICWMALSFYLVSRNGHRNWLFLLWSLPFALITYYQNNLLLVFFTASAAAGLICSLFRAQSSARKIFVFQGLAFATILFFIEQSPIIYRSSWLTAVMMLPLCWIPGYWFIRQCENEGSRAALAITWLIPLLSGTLLSQVLYNAPLGKSLFSFWFFIVSFNHAVPCISLILAGSAIAITAGLFSQRLLRPVFLLSAATLAALYLVDAGLLYQNGMRFSFPALQWFLGQQNLTVILKTIGLIIEWKIIAVIVFMPLLIHLLFKSISLRINTGKHLLSGTFTFMVIAAQFSLIGYQLMTDYPSLLRDSGRVFLDSFPAPAFMAPEKVTTIELIKGMNECRAPLSTGAISTASSTDEIDNRKNLILIVLESTSTRYLSLFGCPDKTWPQLENLRERIEIFPFFFSCFPESSSADFAILSGLYSPDRLLFNEASGYCHPTLIEKLTDAGYDCSMFLSGFIGDTGWKSLFQPRGFTRLYDAVSLPDTTREDGWVWGIKEHVAVERISRLLQQKAAAPDKPFLIYYRMVFPHAPFDRVTDDPPHFPEDDYYQGSWVGRYKNCLLYQDAQIARLVDEVEKCGLRNKTMIAIVGDHGTMLGEDGLTGHGWNLAPELANVPFVIIRPEETGFKINNQPGSQADLQPTLLELAGVQNRIPSFVQGKSLLQPRNASDSIYLGSMKHKAVVEDGHYFVFPFEHSPDAMIFKLDENSPNRRFIQLTAWQPENLGARFMRTKKFFRLQGQLLGDIEHYSHDCFKR